MSDPSVLNRTQWIALRDEQKVALDQAVAERNAVAREQHDLWAQMTELDRRIARLREAITAIDRVLAVEA